MIEHIQADHEEGDGTGARLVRFTVEPIKAAPDVLAVLRLVQENLTIKARAATEPQGAPDGDAFRANLVAGYKAGLAGRGSVSVAYL